MWCWGDSCKEGWWKFITYLCASMEDDDSYNILKPLMLAKSMVATSMSYHCPHSFAPSKIWCQTSTTTWPIKKIITHTMQDDAQEECPTYIVMISILAFLVRCFEASCPHLCPSFTTMNFLQIYDKNQSFWDEWRRLISFLPNVTKDSLPRLCVGRL